MFFSVINAGNNAFADNYSSAGFTVFMEKQAEVEFQVKDSSGNDTGLVLAITLGSLGGAATLTYLGSLSPVQMVFAPVYRKFKNFWQEKPVITKPGRIALINSNFEKALQPKEIFKFIENALKGGNKNPNIIVYKIQIENKLIDPNKDIALNSGKNPEERLFCIKPELIKSSFNKKDDLCGTYTGELTCTFYGEI